MQRSQRLQNHLLQEADKILRGGNSAILTRNVGRGTCNAAMKAQARAKVDARRGAAETIFRSMPKEQRKVLTERFKSHREAGLIARQSWLDWLEHELKAPQWAVAAMNAGSP